MDASKQPPRYSEKMLIGLIRETKTLEDLTDLCNLYRQIEKQEDISITHKMRREIGLQQRTIIYGGDIIGDQNTGNE